VNRRSRALSIGLVFVAVAIAALWTWRARAPEDDPAQPLAPAAASGSSGPAGSERPSGSAGRELADSQPAGATSQRRPTLGLPPPNARASRDTRQLSPEELEKLGPQIERYQKAWERYLAPLLYPEGHPQEGEYLDNVTCDAAVEAQLGYYEDISPPGYLDKPRFHLQKRINYSDLSKRQETWNPSDFASTREFYEWLVAQKEDPTALRGDLWLDADPSDQDATTRREFLREKIRALEAICRAP
jgi:hypothetical protein